MIITGKKKNTKNGRVSQKGKYERSRRQGLNGEERVPILDLFIAEGQRNSQGSAVRQRSDSRACVCVGVGRELHQQSARSM